MRRSALLGFCAVAVGCGGDTGAGVGLAVNDSAGVRLVQNLKPAADTVVLKTPTVAIGGVDVPEPYIFQDVRDIVPLSDGSIVVADAGSRVAVFAPDGSWRTDIGRRGHGPGEYQQPYQLDIRRDTVVLWDVTLNRLSIFRQDASFIGTVPVTKRSPTTRFQWLGRLLVDEVEWGQTAEPTAADAAMTIVSACFIVSSTIRVGVHAESQREDGGAAVRLLLGRLRALQPRGVRLA